MFFFCLGLGLGLVSLVFGIKFPLVFGSRFVNRMNTRLNICCLDGPGEDSIRRPVPGGGL